MKETTMIALALAGVAGVFLLSRPSIAAPPAPAPTPPAPTPGTPTVTDVLKQQVDMLLAQAAASPASVNPDAMEQLALSLDQAGLASDAARVRAAEAAVRASQMRPPPITSTNPGQPPPMMPPPSSTVSAATLAKVHAALTSPNVSPHQLRLLATQLGLAQGQGGTMFADLIQALRDRANQLIAAGAPVGA